jgi:DNA topoisomerase-6 subunit B
MAGKKIAEEGQLSFGFEAEKVSVEKTRKKAAVKAAKGSGQKRQGGTTKENTSSAKKTKAKKVAEHIKDENIAAQAEAMALQQRDISVSEFFAKNRHLLGFDNPSKALLTAVKEAVDNSLDACEESCILPDIEVGIQQRAENRFRMWVQDNGPGIVKEQIPNIFGRLLYGSKFHTLRMARGQQGIGISAAGMYGMLTTGKGMEIKSKTGPTSKAHAYTLRIDTKKNRPDIISDSVIEWDVRSGTRVEIEMEARYQRGRQSVDEYLAQTAITNPHAQIRYIMPDGREHTYKRSVEDVVTVPEAVKPHPYGVELGVLIKMTQDTEEKTMASFLCKDFCRVSPRVSQQILEEARISTRKKPRSLSHNEAENLYRVINETKIMAPSTSCVVPIGQEELLKGLRQVVAADFYTACTRPPAVYRGNPFQIEAALAYGGNGYDVEVGEDDASGTSGNGKDGSGQQELIRVLRFANRVPLLYQQSGCAIFKSILQMNWRQYGLSQSKGALPAGPVTIILHMASVWVPFTSESKEAVAHYPEIIKEIKLALAECGRRLGSYLRGVKRQHAESVKQSYIKKYLPAIGEALQEILSLKDKQVTGLLVDLREVLEKSRSNK